MTGPPSQVDLYPQLFKRDKDDQYRTYGKSSHIRDPKQVKYRGTNKKERDH